MSNKTKKLSRVRDTRKALVRNLAVSLIEEEGITTTLSKAKVVVPFVEKLITKAKIGDLHRRRQIISRLGDELTANKLVDEIAPKLGKRTSGHLRITKGGLRRGDGTQVASVEFVDDLSEDKKDTQPKAKVSKAQKTEKSDADAGTKSAKKPANSQVKKKPTSPKSKSTSEAKK